MNEQLESFAEAFSPNAGTCRIDCECGRIFYDDFNSGYSWEEGEYEKLEKQGIAIGHSLGWIMFEGHEYAYDCECWHTKAEQLIGFMVTHRNSIADFFKREKERLTRNADAFPTIAD